MVAADLNPASFGGVNLITALDALYDSTTGVFGDGEAFSQSLAVQGLVAAGQTVPAAPSTTSSPRRTVTAAGTSCSSRTIPTAATDFDTSDTNSTAMVLMALNATGRRGRNATALAWLHTQQDGDGGFPYQAGAGTDPDSTALVLQALIAVARIRSRSTWAVGGHTALSSLLATQNSNGGYTFPGDTGPDPFTTAQVPPALERAAFPLTCGPAPCFKAGATLP